MNESPYKPETVFPELKVDQETTIVVDGESIEGFITGIYRPETGPVIEMEVDRMHRKFQHNGRRWVEINLFD